MFLFWRDRIFCIFKVLFERPFKLLNGIIHKHSSHLVLARYGLQLSQVQFLQVQNLGNSTDCIIIHSFPNVNLQLKPLPTVFQKIYFCFPPKKLMKNMFGNYKACLFIVLDVQYYSLYINFTGLICVTMIVLM